MLVLLYSLNKMGKVIGIISLKGGVGKTTIAAALASDLVHAHGQKVLLVDANYSAPNIGLHMDVLCPHHTIHDVLYGGKLSAAIHERYGVDVIPGNFLYSRSINPLKLRARLAHIKKQYDFIVIDSPPSVQEDFLSTFYTADEFFIVTTPDYPSLTGAMKLARLARQRNTPIAGLIVNRIVDTHLQLTLREIQESTNLPVVSMISEEPAVLKALFARVPTTIHAKRAKFTKAINRLSCALVGKPESSGWFEQLFAKQDSVKNREALREHFYTSIFKK